MPSYLEITQLAVRTIVVKVRGIEITVTERLMKDPAAAIKARERIKAVAKTMEEAFAVAEGAQGADDALTEMKAQLAALRAQTAVDQREVLVSSLCSRLESWDLTDGKKPLPLDPDKLYDLPVPDELLRELLEAIDKEPIVPEAKG